MKIIGLVRSWWMRALFYSTVFKLEKKIADLETQRVDLSKRSNIPWRCLVELDQQIDALRQKRDRFAHYKTVLL